MVHSSFTFLDSAVLVVKGDQENDRNELKKVMKINTDWFHAIC